MNEFFDRFTEGERYFMDGMTNVFTVMVGGDIQPSELSTTTLFHIFNFCVHRLSESRKLQLQIYLRYKQGLHMEDIYEELFDTYEDFFEDLVKQQKSGIFAL